MEVSLDSKIQNKKNKGKTKLSFKDIPVDFNKYFLSLTGFHPSSGCLWDNDLVKDRQPSISLFTNCKQSLRQGNVFTGVCLSTGDLCFGGEGLRRSPNQKSERYASYWNAFLSVLKILSWLT